MKQRQETPAEAMERLRRKIRTEYAEKAVNGLVAICEDKSAPAPARAAAGVAILRAAGLFVAADEVEEKEPWTITRAELDKAAAQARRTLRAHGIDVDGDDDEDGVLG